MVTGLFSRILSCLIIFELILGPLVGPLAQAHDENNAHAFLSEYFFKRLPSNQAEAEAELKIRYTELDAYLRAWRSPYTATDTSDINVDRAQSIYRALGGQLAQHLHHPSRLQYMGARQDRPAYRSSEAPTSLTGEQIQIRAEQTLQAARIQAETVRRNIAQPNDGFFARVKQRGRTVLGIIGVITAVSAAHQYTESNWIHDEYRTPEDYTLHYSPYSIRSYVENHKPSSDGTAILESFKQINPLPFISHPFLIRHFGQRDLIDGHVHRSQQNNLHIPALYSANQAERRSAVEQISWLDTYGRLTLIERLSMHQDDLEALGQLVNEIQPQYEYGTTHNLPGIDGIDGLTDTQRSQNEQASEILVRINDGLADWYVETHHTPQAYAVRAAADGGVPAALLILLMYAGYALDRRKGSVLRKDLLKTLAEGYEAGCSAINTAPDPAITAALHSGDFDGVARAIPIEPPATGLCEKALNVPHVRVATSQDAQQDTQAIQDEIPVLNNTLQRTQSHTTDK